MKTRGPVPSPLRYCASCAVTLLCWAAWLVLGAGLAVQGYIGVARDVPVPEFVLRRIEAAVAGENFLVRFGGAHLDPTGQLLLENVQVRSRAFEEPLLSSRLLYVRKSFWSVLAGRPVPDEIRLEGATLQLPAIFSPSGTTEPLLREMAGRLRFESGNCLIDQLAFHVGNMSVAVSGVVTPPRNIHGKPLAPDAIVGKFLQYGRQVALMLPRLEAADRPALVIEAAARPQGGMNLRFQFTADGVSQPTALPVEVGPLGITGHWAWDGLRPHPMRVHVTTRSVNGPAGLAATNLHGSIVLEPPEMEFAAVDRIDLRVAATSVQALGENWLGPVVTGSYSLRAGAGRFAAAVRSHGELLSADGDANARERTAQIEFSGQVPPALVTGLLTRYGPKLEPYFRFGDPVDVQAHVDVGPGWRFAGLASHVRGGRLDSHGVQVTSTRGRIDVDAKMNFLAYDAEVVAGENLARGSYWMNFRSLDYRMLLIGRLRPPDITGWFRGEWWPNFWKNFAFPVTPPQADVDVQGCWRDPVRTSYFGSTDAAMPTVLGASFNRARTRIFVRPDFAHVLELAVERNGGAERASGWFKRFGEAPSHPGATSSLEYDLTGNLALPAYQAMGGAAATGLLDAWRFDQPPQVHVAGHTVISGGKAANALRFSGDSQGGLQYQGFPLDHLTVAGGLQGDELTIERFDFQFAGGTGGGKVSLGGPPDARLLSLDGSLKDADLAKTIRAVENFAAIRTGAKATSMAESKFIKRASGGKLELTLSAQGNPADPASLRGGGTAQLTGAELGEIHLFGLLSQVLSAVALNFSSLKLDAARTSFQLVDGRVHFPDVKISGPSAVIDAKGDYRFAGKTLDFTAKLKPYEESHNPLTAVVGIVINPLTSIFELKLTGPLSKPSWSVVLGQGPKPEEPAVPAVTPAPATTPPEEPKKAEPAPGAGHGA